MEAGEGERATAIAPAGGRSRPATALVLVALALLGGSFPSFSLGAAMLVVIVGGGLFVAGLRSGAAPQARAFPPGTRWWLLPVGGLFVLETVNFLLGSTYQHPTLSQLADPWLDRYPVRTGVFLGWVSAFWALARR